MLVELDCSAAAAAELSCKMVKFSVILILINSCSDICWKKGFVLFIYSLT